MGPRMKAGKASLLVLMLVLICAVDGIAVRGEITEFPTAEGQGVPSGLTELRRLIDRGQAAAALKQLDALATQQPVVPGVQTLRGIALYAQSNFADADAAFEIALKQNAEDQEATQMRGLTLFRL